MVFRKFYLQDAKGARFDLNGANGVYATDPSGLGIALSPAFASLGAGFFKATATKTEPQRSPGFTVNFTRRATAYDQYREFTRFLSAAGDVLRLVYKPWGTAEYYRDVMLAALEKTELTEVGWLVCPMEVKALTPWYLPQTYRVELSAQAPTSMRYPFRYGSARYGAGRAPVFGAVLQPAGDIPAGLRLLFDGEAEDPAITLVGLSTGKIYGRCDIAYTFVAGDQLQWATLPDDGYCRLLRAGDLVDLSGYLDMTGEPFFQMPVTEPCILQLTGSGLSGSGELSVNYYYRTV